MAVVLVAMASLGMGCGAVPLPCNLAIAAVPADLPLEEGDPLPGSLPLLAGPADFDQDAVRVLADANGETTIVDLQLRGDAVARFAAYTTGHAGELMAIAVNGTVVALPTIEGAIPDGRLQIASGLLGESDFGERFAGCVR